MAEDLRYLDAENGEMGWSVPSVGAATHSINYAGFLAGKLDTSIQSAKPGEEVTINWNSGLYPSTPGKEYYVGIAKVSVEVTAYGYLDQRKGPSGLPSGLFPYTFLMPDYDVTVWLFQHDIAGGEVS